MGASFCDHLAKLNGKRVDGEGSADLAGSASSPDLLSKNDYRMSHPFSLKASVLSYGW
jgi:hypothetical protein